jgi:hypothetical protein
MEVNILAFFSFVNINLFLPSFLIVPQTILFDMA